MPDTAAAVESFEALDRSPEGFREIGSIGPVGGACGALPVFGYEPNRN